jgi:hypothetical protein
MIDYHIQPEMQTISQTLNKKNAGQQIDSSLAGLEVLNMLNTKYIIYNEKARPIQNPYALGNAWFVDGYRFVDNAREEINALDGFNPAQTAIIDKDFSNQIENKNFSKDTSGTITLTHYEPNHLKYQSQADNDQLVVFSEVYYPHGWKLFIDGEPADIFRANYILRAAVVPKGKHTLEMKFGPQSYISGNNISSYSSIVLLILLILSITYEMYLYMKKI